MKESEATPFFENYYDRLRSDVIEAVPPDTKVVLSVGCACGRTEAELIKKGIKVVGVELNQDAAQIAHKRGIEVLDGDANQVDVKAAGYIYDFMIYADVLEHLPDPSRVLKDHVQCLRPGGKVYICVPNFRNFSVFWQLFIQGHIRYQDGGILDRTHLRNTTRKMVKQWFQEAGLVEEFCKYHIYKRRHKWLSFLTMGILREYLASQIVLIGVKPNVDTKS